MINLEEHKEFIYSHKMDMVPYSIAVQAVEEAMQQAVDSTENKLDEALDLIEKSLYNIDLDIDDKDSTRSTD